jgi:hypothetical protein
MAGESAQPNTPLSPSTTASQYGPLRHRVTARRTPNGASQTPLSPTTSTVSSERTVAYHPYADHGVPLRSPPSARSTPRTSTPVGATLRSSPPTTPEEIQRSKETLAAICKKDARDRQVSRNRILQRPEIKRWTSTSCHASVSTSSIQIHRDYKVMNTHRLYGPPPAAG